MWQGDRWFAVPSLLPRVRHDGGQDQQDTLGQESRRVYITEIRGKKVFLPIFSFPSLLVLFLLRFFSI